MKVIGVKDYVEMCQKAKEIVVSTVRSKQKVNLGLATGSTPMGLYKDMVEDFKNNGTSYHNVTTFNLDEYVGLDGGSKQSYRYYMNTYLFDYIDIPKEHIFIPNGKAKNLEEECKRFDELIQKSGNIDLQILGIGRNGHIGFNEPGSRFDSRTHVVKLSESTRQANSRYFPSIADVPTHAITMGIQTILESRKIILLASGDSKANVISRLLTEEPSSKLPASALKHHPDVLIIADEKALQYVASK